MKMINIYTLRVERVSEDSQKNSNTVEKLLLAVFVHRFPIETIKNTEILKVIMSQGSHRFRFEGAILHRLERTKHLEQSCVVNFGDSLFSYSPSQLLVHSKRAPQTLQQHK
jgi:hypothetical protein